MGTQRCGYIFINGYTSTVKPAPSGILTPYDYDVNEEDFVAQGEVKPGEKAKKRSPRWGTTHL